MADHVQINSINEKELAAFRREEVTVGKTSFIAATTYRH